MSHGGLASLLKETSKMRRKSKIGRSLVIGSCGSMNSQLAVTFGAKLAYSGFVDPNKRGKPILTTLGVAPYNNVLFVDDGVGNFKGGFYGRICDALGYVQSAANPFFVNIERPKKIIEDGLLSPIIEIAQRTATDVIVFPYFSTFSKEYHPLQERIANTICVVDFITDMGFDVIYTTPFFEDDTIIKDGTWPRNPFFASADFSLFIEDGEFEDKKVLHRLVADGKKPRLITEPVLCRLAILDANDLSSLGETSEF